MKAKSHERDPRIDPKPGDHIAKGNRSRCVAYVSGRNIAYRANEEMATRTCWITTWQDWAKNAEVLHVAE